MPVVVDTWEGPERRPGDLLIPAGSDTEVRL